MRKYEKQTRTVENNVCTELTCDLCGRIGKDGGWEESVSEIAETKVKCKTGSADPDGGGCSTTISADICPDCFTNKLVPWLQSQGAKIEPVKSEW